MSRPLATWIAAVAIAIAGVLAIAFGWAYLVFVHGSRTRVALGGQWEVEDRSTPMGHGGGGGFKLYRREGWSRLLVDELVYTNQYYGDDCVAYVTKRGGFGGSYYAACGARQPVLLGRREFGAVNGESHLREWRIDPDGVVEMQSTPSGQVERRLSVGEIKRRALAQPLLKEGWRATEETAEHP